jgi:hypothetical protein
MEEAGGSRRSWREWAVRGYWGLESSGMKG